MMKLKSPFSLKLNSKAGKIMFAAGVIGIVLLFISNFTNKNAAEATVAKNAASSENYIEATEKRLKEIVGAIAGDEAEVMVTLETGVEYVYASETKSDSGISEDISGAEKTRTQQSDSNQESYITVKDGNGAEQPLVVTEIMPSIRGVVVVCRNGDNEAVAAAVKSAIVTALNINIKRVCVLGKTN